jgi:hypothetical protein
MSVSDNIVVNKELTPELLKRKEELDWGLGLELDRLQFDKGLTWAMRSAQSDKYKQKYEDLWIQELTDAGYIVRHIFEGLENDSEEELLEDWYEELNKIN